MTGELSRRVLMRTTVAVCSLALGFPKSSIIAGRFGDKHLLFALCSDLKCPNVIGVACLESLPAAEASPEILASLIMQDAVSQVGALASSTMVRQLVRAQIQRDFRAGAVTNVDGWMLSLTETRLYALSSLLAHEPRPKFPEAGASAKL